MRNLVIIVLLIISKLSSSQCNISINGASTRTICQNSSLTLQTSGSNGLAYQWYSNSSPSNAGGTSIGGASSSSFSVNTVNVGTFYYYVVGTATSPACVDTSGVVTVVINPVASVSNMTAVVCSGSLFSVAPTNGANGIVPANTTYTWTVSNSNVTGESNNSSGSSVISQTLSNTTNIAQSVVYNVLATTGSCTGNSFTVTVTVNPIPVITAMSTSVCSGLAFNVSPSNATNGIVPSGTTYNWTVNSPNVTGESNNSNPVGAISQTLSQVTNVAQSTVYAVIPTSGSCQGSAFNLTVTVDPVAAITSMSATSCSGSAFSASPSNGTNGVVPSGTTYTWTASSSNVTGVSSVSSGVNTISQSLSHSSSSVESVIYTVTPTSGACTGSNFSLTVNVNPTPFVIAVNETICSGSLFSSNILNGAGNIVPVGTIYDWTVGSNSNVNGESNAQNQSTISQSLTNLTNVVQTITYSVTPESGNCSGAQFSVTVNVNPVPSVANLSAIICEASDYVFTPVNGGGSIVPANTTMTWTGTSSSLLGITDNVASSSTFIQNLSNPTIIQQSAVYSIVPSTPSCQGLPFQITLGVNPRPEVSGMETAICSGDFFGVNPSNGVDGLIPSPTNYSWNVISNADVTNESNGSSSISISQNLLSNSDTETTVSYDVTPSFAGCVGSAFDLNVLVRPTPLVNDVFVEVCNEDQFEVIPATGNGNIVPSETTYSWNFQDNLSLENEQQGVDANSISGSLNILNYSDQTIVYHVSPHTEFCNGGEFDVNILVEKTPQLFAISDQFICEGGNVQLHAVDLFAVPNTVYNWSLSSDSQSLSFPYIASPIASPSETTEYIVIMNDPVHTDCFSSDTVVVHVINSPEVNAGSDITICEGMSAQIQATGEGSISWEPSIGLTSVNDFSPGASPVTTTTYHAVVTNSEYGCSSEDDITVYVESNPVISVQAPDEVCQFSTVVLETFGTDLEWDYQWMSNDGEILGVASTLDYNAINVGIQNVELNVTTAEGCMGSTTASFTVNSAPMPSIGGPNSVCENSYWQPYQVNSSGSSYEWTIENGEIVSGEGNNEILVHWFLGSEGQLSVVEHEFVNGCEGSSLLNVVFSGSAPDMQDVNILSESLNTLYCPNNSFMYYKWGYTSVQTGIDAFIGQNESYATYSVFDPTNYYYWVDLGDDLSCLTRSYYNSPQIVYSVSENHSNVSLSIYPNPSLNDFIYLSIDSDNFQLGQCQVWSMDGKMISASLVNQGTNRLDISDFSAGVYQFRVVLENGEVINRTIIIQ